MTNETPEAVLKYPPVFFVKNWMLAIPSRFGKVVLEPHCWDGISCFSMAYTNVADHLGGKAAIMDAIMRCLGVVQSKKVTYNLYGTNFLGSWGQYYTPREEGQVGRIWVDHSQTRDFIYLPSIHGTGRDYKLKTVTFNHNNSFSISTSRFDLASTTYPDKPIAPPDLIETYRSKFLELMLEIARLFGKITSVQIVYRGVFPPEGLFERGFHSVCQIAGESGKWTGRQREVMSALRTGEFGFERFVQFSNTSTIPWVGVRAVNVKSDITVKDLESYLTF